MPFKDSDRDLGKHVAFAVNDKGTGRRGVPTAVAMLSETETAAPVAEPKKLTSTGNSVRALRDLGAKRTIKSKI
jgi:hypothetical protein